jgi:hypothetical protein
LFSVQAYLKKLGPINFTVPSGFGTAVVREPEPAENPLLNNVVSLFGRMISYIYI